jgi:hypothetical protein
VVNRSRILDSQLTWHGGEHGPGPSRRQLWFDPNDGLTPMMTPMTMMPAEYVMKVQFIRSQRRPGRFFCEHPPAIGGGAGSDGGRTGPVATAGAVGLAAQAIGSPGGFPKGETIANGFFSRIIMYDRPVSGPTASGSTVQYLRRKHRKALAGKLLVNGLLRSPLDRLHLCWTPTDSFVNMGAWQRLTDGAWIIKLWNICG